MTDSVAERRARFRSLHEREQLFVMPNPWDVGSARLLQSVGFEAIATTSAGFAWSLGRLDQTVSRDELVAHVATLAAATDLPLNVDSERCYPDDPGGVTRTVDLLSEAGAAGFSIEDFDPGKGGMDALGLATERVAEAAEASQQGVLLTARAENHIRGNPDLDDTIARLQAFEEAGADVLYAPGLGSVDEIRAVCEAVSKPVNVLAVASLSVAEIFGAGAQRISVGGALTWVAAKAFADAATAIRDDGDFSALAARVPLDRWL